MGLGDEQRPQALVHAPLAVVPVPFPRAAFEQAYAAAPVFNALIDLVARDGAYLRRTLLPAAEFDDFTVSGCVSLSACPARMKMMCTWHSSIWVLGLDSTTRAGTAHLCSLQASMWSHRRPA